MSMLPSLLETYIQRLIQFEPMLGMATVGIMLKVPVVSMRSMLELMGGQEVSNKEDEEAMRSYLIRCMQGSDGLRLLPFVGMDEYGTGGSNHGKFPGYITCTLLKEAFSSVSMQGTNGSMQGQARSSGSSGGAQGGAAQQQSSLFGGTAPNGVPMEPLVNISRRIWMTNQKVTLHAVHWPIFEYFVMFKTLLWYFIMFETS
jgi:hypothetical protein